MRLSASVFVASILLVVSSASAETIVLTLDEAVRPPDLQCGQTWTEAGVELEVLPTSLERCGLSLCNINLAASPVSLVLVPGELHMDFSAVPGTVHTVEAIVGTVILDFERLCLYDDDELVACEVVNHTLPEDTVSVTSGGAPVTRAVWEPCFETAVFGVLVHFAPDATPVPAPPGAPTDVAHLLSPLPHPLRAGGVLRFDLPREASARITVHDVAGRLVRTLRAGRRASGRHAVAFDGRDEGARPLPAGVYFQRLVVNGRVTDTERFVMLR